MTTYKLVISKRIGSEIIDESATIDATPMKARAEAYRLAHLDGVLHVKLTTVADETIGDMHGKSSSGNPNLWMTDCKPSYRNMLGIRIQVIDSKGRLSDIWNQP